VPGKTRRVPTEKNQEAWQGGRRHWYKRKMFDLTRCLGFATVVGGGMKLLDPQRRVSTGGGSVDNFEDRQVVGKTKTAIGAWLLQPMSV
jgi:hypothetical protein